MDDPVTEPPEKDSGGRDGSPRRPAGVAVDLRATASDAFGLHQALLKADRSASLGPQAAGLARELNDALTRIVGAVHQVGAGTPGALAQAEEACAEARDLTRQLAALGAGGDGRRASIGARDLLERASALAAAGTAVETTIEASERTRPVWADAEQMGQAFRNLIRNAVEAMHPTPLRPQVQLRASNLPLSDGQVSGLPAGDYVEFEVRDNGCGIAPDILDKIWEPLFTTKKHRSGLGLSAAMAIIRDHGGQIGVDSTPGVGTVFTVYLPSRPPPSAVEARRAPSERFATGRILVMDDDPEIRSAIEVMLQKLDYKCDLAADQDETLAFYRRYHDVGRPYDAVLLDQSVAGQPADELILARLRRLDPDVRAIALGGALDGGAARSRLAAGYCGTLAKPFRLAELAKALRSVTG